MDPLLQSYARAVHESLEDLPNELQQLVTHVRESDILITNLLSEIEGEGLSGERALHLNQTYKYKSDLVSELVKLIEDKLSSLDSSYTDVTAAPKLVVLNAVRGNIINSVEIPFNKPVNKRRRKQPRNEIVRNPILRQVSPPIIPAPEDSSTKVASVCLCKRNVIWRNDRVSESRV